MGAHDEGRITQSGRNSAPGQPGAIIKFVYKGEPGRRAEAGSGGLTIYRPLGTPAS
jgi:hypothetical protein